ncbi:MAG: hypothetical protein JO252_18085, partial [Planctomycetaceae bacterium]|nr:hypothetical protein [Planctomycetaceae bacterium]
ERGSRLEQRAGLVRRPGQRPQELGLPPALWGRRRGVGKRSRKITKNFDEVGPDCRGRRRGGGQRVRGLGTGSRQRQDPPQERHGQQ